MAGYECLHCGHEWRGDPGPQKNPCCAKDATCPWNLCTRTQPHSSCPWGNCPECGGLYADWLNYDHDTLAILDDQDVPPRGSAAREQRKRIWRR